MSNQSTIDAVISSVNETCLKKGGIYSEYQCQVVSWGDATRGVLDGQLSVVGPNITDCRLYAKSGDRLFTVRSENWNEKLSKISADKIAVRVGNHEAGTSQLNLETVSLEYFLKKIGKYGQYAGLNSETDLFSPILDKEISIRFQTTFLPVEKGEKASIEFVSETYNHNTFSDTDPKNLLLLCTTQGTAIQQDGDGCKKLFHHSIDFGGRVHRHWLEAETTRHQVGGPQKETKEEREDALARGKATSELIGTESMGSRFNVLMTVQIPLQQINPSAPLTIEGLKSICRALGTTPEEQTQILAQYGPATNTRMTTTTTARPATVRPALAVADQPKDQTKRHWWKWGSRKAEEHRNFSPPAPTRKGLSKLNVESSYDSYDCRGSVGYSYDKKQGRNHQLERNKKARRKPAPTELKAEPKSDVRYEHSGYHFCDVQEDEYSESSVIQQRPRRAAMLPTTQIESQTRKTIGSSFAARISRGSEEDIWPGLTLLLPKRSEVEHITVTVVIYNVVAGGLPSADDVIRAIDDMEELYESCSWTGRLADDGASFVKSQISPIEALRIAMPVKL